MSQSSTEFRPENTIDVEVAPVGKETTEYTKPKKIPAWVYPVLGLVSILIIALTLMQFILPQESKPTTLLGLTKTTQTDKQATKIIDFESCKAAGNPILETYPERCMDGTQTYTRVLSQEEQDKMKNGLIDSMGKPVEQKETYTSTNFPSLKIVYPKGWNMERNNLKFPDGSDTAVKDEAGKEMIRGQIKLTKENYELEYMVVPNWDFGGYGPTSNCILSDPYNKLIKNDLGRVQTFNSKLPGQYTNLDKAFKYRYYYVNGIETDSNPNFPKNFSEDDQPFTYPGKPDEYFGCYYQSRETGATLIPTSYKQNGQNIQAAVQITFKIKGENRNEEIFKEVDEIVLSSIK
jgi:hypothetical protein